MSYFAVQALKIATESEDEDGVLVSADERAIAILVRLEAAYHGKDRGKWHLEAGFGRCAAAAPSTFPCLSDALRWIAMRCGRDVGDLAQEVDDIGRTFNSAEAIQ